MPPFSREFREDEIAEITEGFARALWVVAYAYYEIERQRGRNRRAWSDSWIYWNGVAGPTPKPVRSAAAKILPAVLPNWTDVVLRARDKTGEVHYDIGYEMGLAATYQTGSGNRLTTIISSEVGRRHDHVKVAFDGKDFTYEVKS